MGVMSEARLATFKRNGLGQGHFEEYQSWLVVSRTNASPISARTSGRVPLYRRLFNFFADAERWIVLLLLWLGAADAREQYPCWPDVHLHPLADYPRYFWRGPTLVRGLRDIAQDAGVEHGYYVGTHIPYVATFDVLGTVELSSGPGLVAFAAKPRNLVAVRDPLDRIGERLELQRRYAEEIGAAFFTIDRDFFPRPLIANLESLCPQIDIVNRLAGDPTFEAFQEYVAERCAGAALRDLARRAATRLRWDLATAFAALDLMIWRQQIDVDISKSILMTRPALPGGRRLRAALQRRILGEVLP